MITTLYFDTLVGEVEFDVNADVYYIPADPSVGYSADYEVEYGSSFKLRGTERKFSRDELACFLALGEVSLESALEAHEDQAIQEWTDQLPEPDFDDYDQ